VTVLEGLAYSRFPCTQVLSVAGLCDIPRLFPLGNGVYSERKSLPDIPRFLTFLIVRTVISGWFVGAQILSFNRL